MYCKYKASAKEIGPDMRIPMFQEVNMATKFLDKEIIHPVSIETGYEPFWKDKKCRVNVVFMYNLTEGTYYKNTNRTKDGHEFYQAGEEYLRPVMREEILSNPDQHRRDFDRLVAEVKDLRELVEAIQENAKAQRESIEPAESFSEIIINDKIESCSENKLGQLIKERNDP